MTNCILNIVGPTGVGKTSFVFNLVRELQNLPEAKTFAGFDLISADSRQVYADLKLISGADIPAEFEFFSQNEVTESYYEFDKIRLYGLSILPYSAEWSVSHFRSFAQARVMRSWSEGRLPIIVGGTGLYHEHLFNPDQKLDIKPNFELRTLLAEESVEELQNRLKKLDGTKFDQMNHSDQNNPTRLVRAIEIAVFNQQPGQVSSQFENHSISPTLVLPPHQDLTIGLTAPLDFIKEQIDKRVESRWEAGVQREIERLGFLAEDLGPNKQILSATGVKEILALINGLAEKDEVLAKWSLREFQYAKRQLTWWKKKETVKWFDVTKEKWQDEAIFLVKKFILPSIN